MTPERERVIERICQAALECPRAEREALLAEACGSDEGVRREVDRLLAQESAASAFLETPAMAVVAQELGAANHALTAGQQLGAYTIVSRLGSGGMGEVYRARDATLRREVAIKVLPSIFTSDAERLARFEREARMLASLNHPNIATIHGVEHVDGIHALILEVVEGETLEERIAGAGPPMAVAEALAIARQIADALEAAHEKGIVHRDLKPANIKTRPDGVVKVLDFGLAKAVRREDGPHAANLSQQRTLTVGHTREGVLLGTTAYMSPEQARGQPVDKRADIWAFGTVLYEMLTGRRAFEGATSSDVIASVLEREPDFHALPASTPPLVRRLLRRCLEKDTRRRLRDISDARMDLEDVPEASPASVRVSSGSSSRALRGRLVVAVAIVAVVLVATWISQPANDRAPRQFVLLPPEGGSFGSGPGDRTPAFALSPDGQRLAFVATVGTNRRVWIRSLESLEAAPLNGSEGAAEFSPPCWSPDGASIAFFAGGKLKKVNVQGGTPVTLADASNGQGLTWSRDGSIVFAPTPNDALLRISDIGGTPVPATRLAAGDLGHVAPQFLPDGRHFLYFVRAASPRKGIYAGSIDTLHETRVRPTREKALFATQGYLLFLEDGRLMAQAFDPRRIELSGDPVPVTDSVAYINTDGRASFDVSPNGTLAYRMSGIRTASQPVWVDRSGKAIGTAGEPGDYSSASLAPDGNRLAVELHDLRTGTGDLWIIDLVRKSTTRFTFDRMHNNLAVWSPDGRDLVFTGRPDGGRNLHMKGVDGSTTDAPLMARGVDRFPSDWSRDRRYILFDEGPSDLQRDLWTLQMPDRTPKPFLRTEFSERRGRFSPNGRWVAYVSNETGRDEVYVRAFPDATGKVQISSNGASGPRWNPDGTELFFVDANNVVQAVSVKAGDGFAAGIPKPLFTAERFFENWFTTDGERFFIVPDPPGSIQTAPPITVVEGWTSLLSTGP